MNWDAIGAVAEAVGGLGVILTLFYLALQIRGSNRVAKAQSRQSMTEFAIGISRFRAEHADRYARINSGGELSAGDKEFLLLEPYANAHLWRSLLPTVSARPYARDSLGRFF